MEAAKLRPDMAEPQRSLAALGIQKGDASLLTSSSEQLIKIEPKVPEGYLYHSIALLNHGDQAGAEADLKKAIEVAPQDPTAYIRMGELRSGQKKPDEAEKFFSKAMALKPGSAEAATVSQIWTLVAISWPRPSVLLSNK